MQHIQTGEQSVAESVALLKALSRACVTRLAMRHVEDRARFAAISRDSTYWGERETVLIERERAPP